MRWLGADDRPQAAACWRALEAEHGAHLSCSWAWTQTWLEHYGGVVPHRFAVLEDGGRPCGIVLVTCSERVRHGVRLRTLHLGTAGEPDGETVFVQYNALLVDPRVREAAAAALLASVARLRWHELRLDGFLPGDADALLDARAGAEVDRQVCRVLPLAGPRPDDVLAPLGASVRKVLRRGLRRLEGVSVDVATTPAEALEILGELEELSNRRWAEEERDGAFGAPRFVAFHRALVARLVPEGRAVLVRVRDGEGTVGCGYVLVDGDGKGLAYQIGRRLEEGNRVSAGQVVELLVMAACAGRGLAVYSHQSGDTEHKRRLSTGEEELVWARWRRGRALGLQRAGRLARLVGR